MKIKMNEIEIIKQEIEEINLKIDLLRRFCKSICWASGGYPQRDFVYCKGEYEMEWIQSFSPNKLSLYVEEKENNDG